MIDLMLLIAFAFGFIGIGIILQKHVTNFHAFALGRQKVSWMILTATLSASFLGGGYSMGVSTKAISVGVAALVGMLGFSLKEILVGYFIAPKMARYPKAVSLGDIMQVHYGTPGKVITGILGALVCVGVLGVQVSALGHIVNVFMGVPYHISVVVGTCVLTLYTLMGGLSAIIITDIVQFVLLIVGIPLTLLLGIQALEAGVFVPAVIERVSELNSTETLWISVSLFLTFMLGETLVPPYVQRLLIGETAEETKKGTLVSGLLSLPFFAVAWMIGVVAVLLFPSGDPNLAMPSVIQHCVPVGLKGLVMVGVISAIMSTADSFLHAGAVSFIHDSVLPFKAKLSEKTELRILKIMIILLGIFSIVGALYVTSLIDLCIYSWTVWSPIVLPPAVLAIFGRPVPFRVAGVGATTGAVIALGWVVWFPDAMFSGLVMGVVSHCIVYCAHWMSRVMR